MANTHWFHSMSPERQKEYIKKHPNSIYAKNAAKSNASQDKKKSKALSRMLEDAEHEHHTGKEKAAKAVRKKHAATLNKLEAAYEKAASAWREADSHLRKTGKKHPEHSVRKKEADRHSKAFHSHVKKVRSELKKAVSKADKEGMKKVNSILSIIKKS